MTLSAKVKVIRVAKVAAVAMVMLGNCLIVSAAETATHADLLWLNRVTYGADATTVERYRALGRSRFLDEQLKVHNAELPAAIAAQIARLTISDTNVNAPKRRLAAVNAAHQRIKALSQDAAKASARKELDKQANAVAHETAQQHVLRAVYSPAQLQEQLVWFWLNHFSVFQNKSTIRWLIADYESTAIRPFALGKFRDLVLATLRHPAMLQYLDNAQNAAGHVNENYARELMELHTLGVNAGYTQRDVQELARILTGVGINAADKTPRLKPEWRSLYRREGAFEFNPARHDFGTKTLLGRKIAGGGFEEIEQAVDVLVTQPACARFVASKLAEYFLGAVPPEKLLQLLARVFASTDGNIAAVLRALLESREFTESLGKQFKDPMHFVISSLRLAYQGKTILDTSPAVKWLNALGEPLYGRQTPDGFPVDERSWASSGQLSRRFEIARAIGSSGAVLFEPLAGADDKLKSSLQLTTRFYFDNIEPYLSDRTRAALDQAASEAEWNTYLLSSPEFNYR